MTELTGMFKRRYELSGRDWVRRISDEDLKVFIHVGLSASDYGRKGGIVRASTAKRDERGRFISDDDIKAEWDRILKGGER